MLRFEKYFPCYFITMFTGLFSGFVWFFWFGELNEAFIIWAFFLFSIFLQFFWERILQKERFNYILSINKTIKENTCQALGHLPVGIIFYDENMKIVWYNSYISNINSSTPKDIILGLYVRDIFTDWDPSFLQMSVRLADRTYNLENDPVKRFLIVQDCSKLEMLQKKCENEKTTFGFLHIDNYDEASRTLPDQESALLLSKVVISLSDWSSDYDIIMKSIDTDRMFFVLNNRSLERLIDSRFQILKRIREVTSYCRIPITISMGIANIGRTYLERSQHAQKALELVLSRGGDQVAIHSGEKINFYGGHSNAVEKKTRVWVRTIAHSLVNLVRKNECVLIMGHVNTDLDAFGASLGVASLVSLHGKKALILLDESSSSISYLIKLIQGHETLSNFLIDEKRAKFLAEDPNTLVVLVDTHIPRLAVSPKVLELAQGRVVVLDHHRRGEEFVKDPLLVYLESSASSTCELVAELLQYQGSRLFLDPLVSTALMAGIIVDTHHFSVRTGSRTFDAASFLRRCGADLSLVGHLLEEDWDHYILRSKLVQSAFFFSEDISIVVADEDQLIDQLIIAQVSDTLLSMRGVEASFVVAKRIDGLIAISARSSGHYNVQVLMEEMGGGGHLTHAACQLKDISLSQAKVKLLSVLKKYI